MFVVLNDSYISPGNKFKAVEHQSIQFMCNTDAHAEWKYSKTPSISDSHTLNADRTLELVSVQMSQAGYYFCYGFDEDLSIHFLSKVNLIVYRKLKVIIIEYQIFNIFDNTILQYIF